ncbi:MAG: HEAT repeat domain-containing protein [Candidatus Omnitrophica bacterium]|nr:HEAT repeat domain-containing protein [Candidatus Omnitrophota bacterium]
MKRFYLTVCLVLVASAAAAAEPSADAKALVAKLQAKDPVVRQEALLRLAMLNEPETATAAQQALVDRVPAVRAQALIALRIAQGANARVPLESALLRDRSRTVRRQAANELQVLRDPASRGTLLRALRERSVEVKVAVLEALAAGGQADVVPQLLPLLRHRHRLVRRAAATAVATLGSAQPGVREAISRQLRDRDELVRQDAVKSLRRLGDATAVPALLPLLADPNDEVRREAFRAIGSLMNSSTLPAVLRLLDHGEPIVRDQAVRLAVESHAPQALAALQARLPQEPNAGVRQTISDALSHWKP